MFIWYAGISHFFLQALQIVRSSSALQRVMMIILGGPKTDRSCPHVLRVKKKLAAAECEIGVSNRENMKILTFHPHQNSIINIQSIQNSHFFILLASEAKLSRQAPPKLRKEPFGDF